MEMIENPQNKKYTEKKYEIKNSNIMNFKEII